MSVFLSAPVLAQSGGSFSSWGHYSDTNGQWTSTDWFKTWVAANSGHIDFTKPGPPPVEVHKDTVGSSTTLSAPYESRSFIETSFDNGPFTSVSGGLNSQFSGVLHWHRVAPNDNPPDHVWVRITPNVGFNTYGAGGDYTTSSSVSVGEGGSNSRLLRLPVVNEEVHLPIVSTGGTMSRNSSTQRPGGYGGIESRLTAKLENRGVYISSDIEKSYKKVTDSNALPTVINPNNGSVGVDTGKISTTTPYSGASSGPWAVECERNLDGSMTVHSAARWDSDVSPPQWLGQRQLTAHSSGFTSPTYEWTAPGVNDLGTYTPPPGYPPNPSVPSPNMPTLSFTARLGYGDGSALESSNAKVVVTESGVSADNTYTINWHFPYEMTQFVSAVPRKEQIRKVLGPINKGDTASVETGGQQDIDMVATINAAGVVAGATGHPEAAGLLKIIGALAGITDWKYHYAGQSATQSGVENGPVKWHATQTDSSWAANVSDPDLLTDDFGYEKCTLELWEVKHITHKKWLADAYGYNGFLSSNNLLEVDQITAVDTEPYYKRVTPPAP